MRSVNGSITSVFRLLEFERKEKCDVSGVRGGVMGRDGGRDDGEMEGAGGGYDMDSDDCPRGIWIGRPGDVKSLITSGFMGRDESLLGCLASLFRRRRKNQVANAPIASPKTSPPAPAPPAEPARAALLPAAPERHDVDEEGRT